MKNADKYLRNYVKAKRVDTEEWVEGFLVLMWQQYHIINPEDENTAYPIDTDTICHCIGSYDLGDRKMYEYDIVKHYNNPRSPENFVMGIIFWNQAKTRYEICALPDLKETRAIHTENLYETVGSCIDQPQLKEIMLSRY